MNSAASRACRLYRDDRFYDHRTGSHPESPRRLAALDDRLDRQKPTGWELVSPCREYAASPAVEQAITRLHAAEYLQQLEAFAVHGGGNWDSDTVICPESVEVARLAASTALEATNDILEGECLRAFCMTRPPGHHALASSAMGFCLLNNVAIAAQHAIDAFGLQRVLIVDWDVHHGNGTQDLFYESGSVWYFSAHRNPFYPGTGGSDERGEGAGRGTTLNLLFSAGVPRETYLSEFERTVTEFAEECQPELICISAGFDAHRQDPIGSLGLETEDFRALTRIVTELAEKHAAGRVLSVLEGGYDPPTLADCVFTHLDELAG